MATKPKEALLDLPGFSVGVRDNAAARMIKLGRPICPNSKIKMVWSDSDNKWVKAPPEQQLQNCQAAGGEWWIECANRGHKPYTTERIWYEKQDKIELVEDETNPGTFFEEVVGVRRIKHVNEYPNIAQVAAHVRVNSGQGVKFKMENHGFVRLASLGYAEVCQFRNCQKHLDAKFSNTPYGSYCSAYHMQLIAADHNGIALHYPNPGLNGEEYGKIQRERRKQLREAVSDV